MAIQDKIYPELNPQNNNDFLIKILTGLLNDQGQATQVLLAVNDLLTQGFRFDQSLTLLGKEQRDVLNKYLAGKNLQTIINLSKIDDFQGKSWLEFAKSLQASSKNIQDQKLAVVILSNLSVELDPVVRNETRQILNPTGAYATYQHVKMAGATLTDFKNIGFLSVATSIGMGVHSRLLKLFVDKASTFMGARVVSYLGALGIEASSLTGLQVGDQMLSGQKFGLSQVVDMAIVNAVTFGTAKSFIKLGTGLSHLAYGSGVALGYVEWKSFTDRLMGFAAGTAGFKYSHDVLAKFNYVPAMGDGGQAWLKAGLDQSALAVAMQMTSVAMGPASQVRQNVRYWQDQLNISQLPKDVFSRLERFAQQYLPSSDAIGPQWAVEGNSIHGLPGRSTLDPSKSFVSYMMGQGRGRGDDLLQNRTKILAAFMALPTIFKGNIERALRESFRTFLEDGDFSELGRVLSVFLQEHILSVFSAIVTEEGSSEHIVSLEALKPLVTSGLQLLELIRGLYTDPEFKAGFASLNRDTAKTVADLVNKSFFRVIRASLSTAVTGELGMLAESLYTFSSRLIGFGFVREPQVQRELLNITRALTIQEKYPDYFKPEVMEALLSEVHPEWLAEWDISEAEIQAGVDAYVQGHLGEYPDMPRYQLMDPAVQDILHQAWFNPAKDKGVNRDVVNRAYEEIAVAHFVLKQHPRYRPAVLQRADTKINDLTGYDIDFLDKTKTTITGSFKDAGGIVAVHDAAANGALQVEDASHGNHGKAVANAARELGLFVTTAIPHTTPTNKQQDLRKLGSYLVITGDQPERGYEEARDRLVRHMVERNLLLERAFGLKNAVQFVHGFEDVIPGQGALAWEIINSIRALPTASQKAYKDAVILVPMGGGGLAAAVAAVMAVEMPKVRVIGVLSDQSPAMLMSLHQGHRVAVTLNERAITDSGIGLSVPGNKPFGIAQAALHAAVSVSEPLVGEAIRYVGKILDYTVEGSAAAGVAAMIKDPSRGGKSRLEEMGVAPGTKVITLLTGRGIDESRWQDVMQNREAALPGGFYDGRVMPYDAAKIAEVRQRARQIPKDVSAEMIGADNETGTYYFDYRTDTHGVPWILQVVLNESARARLYPNRIYLFLPDGIDLSKVTQSVHLSELMNPLRGFPQNSFEIVLFSKNIFKRPGSKVSYQQATLMMQADKAVWQTDP